VRRPPDGVPIRVPRHRRRIVKIHRSSPDGDFVIIPNETLRDERLSFAARGQLAYLLSRPDDWRTSADDEAERATRLRNKRGEGREAMRAVWRELKDAGYIRLVKLVSAGRWTTETHVYDRPFTEFPQVAPTYGLPGVGQSGVGSPGVGSPGVGSPGVGSPDGRFTRTSSTKTDHEDQDRPRVQGQGQEPSVRKSQKPRLPDGPETVAGDVRQIPPDNSGSATTDRYARESGRKTARPAA
jgi:hypothetical protein